MQKDQTNTNLPELENVFLTEEDVQEISNMISQDQSLLLQIEQVRALLANSRLKKLSEKDIRTLKDHDKSVITNAIEHNMDGLVRGMALTRPELLIGPLFSLDLIRTRVRSLKFLSVGPRSEAELFGLMARGVPVTHLRGLDLISYSPYVDLGDMHHMPYPDKSFDVIILGWVLAYSKDHKKVREEVLRVAKPGAILAIGCEYHPMSTEQLMQMGGHLQGDYPRFYHTDDIFKIFEGHVDAVFFKHDVLPELRARVGSVMTVFRLKQDARLES
jgi:SAM-dependent methyltransferase